VASGGDCRAVDFEAPGAPEVDGAPETDGARDEFPAFVEFPALGKLPGGLEEACRLHPDRVNTAANQIPVTKQVDRHQQGVNQTLLIGLPASILIPHFSGIIGRDFGD
jgi:hypothetical protein